MKIAAVTDDGTTIHSHFGQAPYYEVLTIEHNAIVARERRDKPAHGHGAHDHHEHAAGGGDTHAQGMAKVIADCSIVLARGMGQPAFQALQAAGLEPVLTELETIDEAVQAYLRGELTHRDNRIHRH